MKPCPIELALMLPDIAQVVLIILYHFRLFSKFTTLLNSFIIVDRHNNWPISNQNLQILHQKRHSNKSNILVESTNSVRNIHIIYLLKLNFFMHADVWWTEQNFVDFKLA